VQKQPRDSRLRPKTIGKLRPDVVLYNENHPKGEEIASIVAHDLQQKPDMLIIMGTTLSIPHTRNLVKMFSQQIHKQGGLVVWIDKEDRAWRAVENSCGKEVFDFFVLGDVDEWCDKAALYWKEKNPLDWNQSVNPKVLSRCEFAEQIDIASFGHPSQKCK
jgi:NAD+-dependent protein deacetylase SIR2